ncbi:MAG: hypothetical protein QNJ12_02850 [Ilumatobacter sp.]|nr:hypothetical protein [Ilumatobacter sp.]MDJ0767698.1 hypothetical protein [Ilumatobacter sp.]
MRRTAAVAVSAAVLGIGAVVVAAISAIDEPATVGEQADRVLPPGPRVGGCPVFPGDNAWNQEIADTPLHPDSDAIIARINSSGGTRLHPDFGENPDFGIPFVVVPADQPEVAIEYRAFGDESDPGPFPIPLDAPVEGGAGAGGDRHVLVLRSGTCELFELYRAFRSGGGWAADSGARFDLTSNDLRPLGWTSADAAGLPILPGLVRYDEVAAGEIRHAIRITFSRTRRGYVLPATHFASDRTDADLPPMGLRLRLTSSYDTSGLTGQARVIAVAMQRYGVIVADNGSNWFFQGAPSPGWDDDDLGQLKGIPGSAFEVVDTGPVLGT